MTEVTLYESAPFESWDKVRAVCLDLDPLRVLKHIVRAAFLEISKEGRFIGDAVHSYINHAILAHVLLRILIDQGRPDDLENAKPLESDEIEKLALILKQLNARSHDLVGSSYGITLIPGSAAHAERTARATWLTSLFAYQRNRPSKFEIARTWLLVRTYWPKCRGRAREELPAFVRVPLDTAFDSIEHVLLLSLAMMSRGGLLRDPKKYLAETALHDYMKEVFESYVPDAADIVGDWSEIEKYPFKNIGGVFRKQPIVRISDELLVAPDPGLLFSGIQDRVLRRLLQNNAVDGPSDLELSQTIIGYVFEEYLQDLLRECATSSSGDKFINEFTLSDKSKTKSPDAFLIAGEVVIFEAKVTGFGGDLDSLIDTDGLISWMRKASGERETRGPLEQGERFRAAWQSGDKEAKAQLGKYGDLSRIYYVIVTPEDIPPLVHWERFRQQFWRPLLSHKARSLDVRTLFVSINDIEALASALKYLREIGEPGSAIEILGNWRKSLLATRGLAHDPKARVLKESLKDHILRRFPAAADTVPTLLQEAFREYFDAAMKVAF